MIKSVTFKNFRNLDGKYEFNNTLNVIIGKNNSGKTNLLDGIKLAFSAITNDYFKISDSDFKDSEDNNVIKISIELQYNSISSLNFDDNGQNKCGFITCIKKTKSGRYIRTFSLLNGTNIDVDIVREDECIPNLYLIPLIRIEDIYTAGLTTGISTTHSSVVINELKMEEIIDISGTSINSLNETYTKKLNTFLHPGRNELMLADNIVLVEGYTEEVLLKYYLSKNNYNWTIINVAGVMFEPYIQLASLLNKKVIVVSDNDKLLSDKQEPSYRFSNLKLICTEKNIKLIEIENTLETDLYINGFLNNCNDLLEKHKKYSEFHVAKHKKKVEIAERLIENDIDLSNWHVIEEIENGFKSN